MAFNFLAMFVISLVLMAATYLFMPTPKIQSAKKAGLNDFSFPTNSNSRVVPEIFGTVKVYPNILWAGDLSSTQIKKEGQVVGYAYFMGVAGALCSRIDRVISFGFGGDITANPNMDVSENSFSAKTGKTAEVAGSASPKSSVKVYFGTQNAPDGYLSSKTNSQIAYKNIAYFVTKAFIGDNVQTIPDYFFVLKRTNLVNGWAFSDIKGDANPAHILYYILTELVKYPASMINVNSFQEAGHKLYQEGLGMSLSLTSENEAKEWCEEILRTIDGVLNIDMKTGLIKLKLLRDDYVVAQLPRIDEGKSADVQFSRKSWENTYSRITIKYTDGKTFNETSLSGVNTAAKLRLGYEKSQTLEFMGISNSANANLLLNRVFKKLSYPLAAVKFTAHISDLGDIGVGDVISFTNLSLGIQNLAIRVISISADKEDNGSIEIEGSEDVFALGNFIISGVQDNESIPEDLSIGELLYYDVKNPTPEFTDTRSIIPMCAYPKGFTQSVEARDAKTGSAINIGDWGLGILAHDYNPELIASIDLTDGFSISPLSRISVINASDAQWQQLHHLAFIGDEIISFQLCLPQTDGTYTITKILRGVFGTKITPHTIGEKVWVSPNTALPLLPIKDINTEISFTPKNFKLSGESKTIGWEYNFCPETPYPPANIQTSRDGATITITWRPTKRGNSYVSADSLLAGEGDYEMEGYYLIEWDTDSRQFTQNDMVDGTFTFQRTDAAPKEYKISCKLSIYQSEIRTITI